MPRLPDPYAQPTLTVPEAARYLNLGRSGGYEAARTGDLPTIRVGRRLLVPTAALWRLLDLPLPARDEAPVATGAPQHPTHLAHDDKEGHPDGTGPL